MEDQPIPPQIIQKINKDYPDKSDAEKYRLCQAEVLIEMFKADNGTAPKSMKEMEDYIIKKNANKRN